MDSYLLHYNLNALKCSCMGHNSEILNQVRMKVLQVCVQLSFV